MKKFTFKSFLRSSVSQQPRSDQEIVETLRSENFQVTKTFRHGFPYQPTAVAFDPVQRLLAIGTKTGSLRILGRPGVDSHVKHEDNVAVIQIQFLINEGALVTATTDNSVHLWNFRQKKPEIVQSVKFQKEEITCIYLPLQSKWLYVGTKNGNVYYVNIETFVISGYIINWNKAIELCRKTHPGAVVHLCENPLDHSKLLIGFETGQLVLWDLCLKKAEHRWQTPEPLTSISWHYDGKQFVCSHTDGSLTYWSTRYLDKPNSINLPHAKTNKDGKLETCKPINKVEWRHLRSGDAFVIFSGGLPHDTAGRSPSITVMQGKNITVLEMEHNVVDFVTLCENPWNFDAPSPYAVVVVLQNDLVVLDLLTPGFPLFENPYPMDLHESPVTCCSYFADCPSDLIPAFYCVGSRGSQRRTGFSEKDWPLSGGEWSPTSCSYNEIILTGHADGSVKFWDASAGSLQVLYKLKTAKVFEKNHSRSMDGSDDEPYAVQLISLCPESRKLCIAGASSYVMLFKFRKLESISETCVLEIPIVYSDTIEGDTELSPEFDFTPRPNSSENDVKKPGADYGLPVKVRSGVQKKPPGFQPFLVCLTPVVAGKKPVQITALSINSSYGLMAYGNENGIAVIDIVQKVCVLNVGTPDLYGACDPYMRVPRSPKCANPSSCDFTSENERCRSPSNDQEQLEEANREALTPEVCLSNTSPLSNEDVETGEDALSSCNDESTVDSSSKSINDKIVSATNELPPAEEANAVEEPKVQTSNEEKNKSDKPHHWKGFSLKKQLSRVDLKIKNTFSSTNPDKESSTSGAKSEVALSKAMSANVSPADVDNSIPEDFCEERLCLENMSDLNCENIPSISVEDKIRCEKNSIQEERDYDKTDAIRPTDLQLFDQNGKPFRPPRSKERKRVSLDKQSAQQPRDTRLLSVPNIKYHHALRDLRKLRPNSSSNPPFANLIRRFNKLDSTSSRSRSSSMSSLENINYEAVQCLAFADSYTKKSDASTFPTLWVGTSLGSVLTIMLNLLPAGDARQTQSVTVTPCGSIFRLSGGILTMSFLDCNGALIPYSYEAWKDESRDKQKTPTKLASNSRMSPPPSGSTEMACDRQFVVIVSEKQARVVALPSHNCVYRQQLVENDFVVKSEIISLKDSVCLVCYISTGRVVAHSLPSLRPLIDIDFLPLADLSFQTRKPGIVDPMLSIWGQQMFVNEDTDQIARTFCFSNRGHGLYLCSPTELQKFTVSAEFSASLAEMMGELFFPHEMPEAPKQSFFVGLFGSGVRTLNREELFGETSSGRASRSLAKHIPRSSAQIEQLGQRASTAASEVSRAHQQVLERGERLSQLEERTQRMMSEAENFSSSAHGLMLKYKDKKWYQL
ncbi:unnamed protein product [Bemisia tabaci]|uniref:Syntaxin-binding protein 5-like n=1 Tax=Bemisia tabaci TaxID=7038 RepID=A0A9P0A986_BEMTA|nr:unnamed protein product [Bemisia tabaci]